MKTASFNKSYVGLRPDVLALIPNHAKYILDIGCSNGALGESIKIALPNAVVTGIELSQNMAIDAATKLDSVIIGNIETDDTFNQLHEKYFDVIIMADLLEHLRDPWTILLKVRNCLRPNGVIVASIPNVRHIDTIYNLVFKGVWPYRDRGIHDKTHLRFFTKQNVVELFQGALLDINQIDTNYRLIERPHRLNRFAKYLALPGIAPFFAFQYLILASPMDTNRDGT